MTLVTPKTENIEFFFLDTSESFLAKIQSVWFQCCLFFFSFASFLFENVIKLKDHYLRLHNKRFLFIKIEFNFTKKFVKINGYLFCIHEYCFIHSTATCSMCVFFVRGAVVVAARTVRNSYVRSRSRTRSLAYILLTLSCVKIVYMCIWYSVQAIRYQLVNTPYTFFSSRMNYQRLDQYSTSH